MAGPFEKLIHEIDPVAEVRRAMAESDFLALLSLAATDPAGGFISGRLRGLNKHEIESLERNDCEAEDWSRLRVADGFRAATVRRVRFFGEVVLGRFGARVEAAPGVYLPSGLQDATLVDVVIGDGALVQDVSLLSGYVIGIGAVILGCGEVVCAPRTRFGVGQTLDLGNEVGGRGVPCYAELTVPVAAAVAARRGDAALQEAYTQAVIEYARQAAAGRGVIADGARVRYTPRVRNSFIGPGALIDAAGAVSGSTLLSAPEDDTSVLTGSLVVNSILQRGVSLNQQAEVSGSFVAGGASLTRGARVRRCYVGPYTQLSCGEAVASLLGPLVGAHHQSLLIAVLWPEGRGNVAYGANVGSNNTGRMADQECRPGEGAFFGLGATIRFPCDFSRAPYLLVASGVTTLPQRVTYPFSLISQPEACHPELSPALNELRPGWGLAENLFAVFRAKVKHRSRTTATGPVVETEVFRPELADLIRAARETLASVSGRELYTERELPGVGKNFLTEVWRLRGIEAYTFFLRYYALQALYRELQRGGRTAAELLAAEPEAGSAWAHAREVLREEYPQAGPEDLLRELVAVAEQAARQSQAARARDDLRGARIIDGYADCHPRAEEEAVVRGVWAEAEAARAFVEAALRPSPADAPAAPDAPESGAAPEAEAEEPSASPSGTGLGGADLSWLEPEAKPYVPDKSAADLWDAPASDPPEKPDAPGATDVTTFTVE